ncbi:EAL domain-containing protein [Thiorhodococcus mannitoliphagus]|uniref:EAL domain-containing protein n=1 Tax=Thiorhodococcus mannitoliphagus TaxID=329406 RepID=A0A6P1DVD5_9GAMM|nr:EAL domain-containing protein [Thiorhodococcus mannitoliphagus]NEX20022.1 EAL domain-containing protein [Thiorhodococcus mannitoliphagus]
MPDHPSTGEILLISADPALAADLAQALDALDLSLVQRQGLSEGISTAGAQRPALLLLDTRLLAEPDEILSFAGQLPTGQGGGSAALVILVDQEDIRYRLAAMRAGAESVFLLGDPVELLAERLAEILGVRHQGPTRVLVVDDQPVAALFASRVLQGVGMVTQRVTNAMDVMDVLDDFRPDLVVMDLHMPGASGIELTGIIRGRDSFADVPIIFLSAELDPDVQMAALRIGGDEFLSKPVAPDRLVNVVRDQLQRATERRRRWRGAVGIDPLTRLATRERLLKRLDWLLGQAYSAQAGVGRHRVDHGRIGHRAIVYLDIMGVDESLQMAAAEVSARLKPDDLAARVSDRSIAILVCRDSNQRVAEFAQSLLFGVGKLLEEKTIGAEVGGGWYPLTGACKDAVTLVSRAAKAARWSLRGGAAEVGRYENAKSAVAHEERRLSVLDAVRYERMELLYEPMVALTGIVGERYEMTPRLIIGDGEVLPPAEFVSTLARSGLAPRFDRWLLSAGLDVLKKKMDAKESVLLFIHQSLLGVAKEDWIYWVRDQINARDLIRQRPVLQFEISEADRQLELAIKRSRQLGRLGIRVCLNGLDFSERSMRVLHSVPSAYVRISRRVIHGPDADSIAWLIQSIKACGARVIATGVDGPAAIARLFSEGVDLIQGPYIQPPGLVMDFEFAAGSEAAA